MEIVTQVISYTLMLHLCEYSKTNSKVKTKKVQN